jgi:hypothetical protein
MVGYLHLVTLEFIFPHYVFILLLVVPVLLLVYVNWKLRLSAVLSPPSVELLLNDHLLLVHLYHIKYWVEEWNRFNLLDLCHCCRMNINRRCHRAPATTEGS